MASSDENIEPTSPTTSESGEKGFTGFLCEDQTIRKTIKMVLKEEAEMASSSSKVTADPSPVKLNPHKRHICRICCKCFRSPSRLKRHLLVHNDERNYTCDECGKAFRQMSDVEHHKKIHRGDRPFKCELCGKSFIENSHLNRHMTVHTGERPHSCEICGKSFRQKSYIKIHMRSHNGEKPFECQVCGKAFTQSNKLIEHLRLHGEERVNICEICDKEFSSASNLKKHLRIHTGIKAYKCENCGKAFTEKSNRDAHQKNTCYKCPECGRAFREGRWLERHLEQNACYTCMECKKVCKNNEDLENHIKEHDMDTLDICSGCGKTFLKRVHLVNHMITSSCRSEIDEILHPELKQYIEVSSISTQKKYLSKINDTVVKDVEKMNDEKRVNKQEEEDKDGDKIDNYVEEKEKDLHLEDKSVFIHFKKVDNISEQECRSVHIFGMKIENLTKEVEFKQKSEKLFHCATCEMIFTEAEKLAEHINELRCSTGEIVSTVTCGICGETFDEKRREIHQCSIIHSSGLEGVGNIDQNIKLKKDSEKHKTAAHKENYMHSCPSCNENDNELSNKDDEEIDKEMSLIKDQNFDDNLDHSISTGSDAQSDWSGRKFTERTNSSLHMSSRLSENNNTLVSDLVHQEIDQTPNEGMNHFDDFLKNHPPFGKAGDIIPEVTNDKFGMHTKSKQCVEPSESLDQRLILCKYCSVPFPDLKSLKEHGKTHTNYCTECGKYFKVNGYLKKHIRFVHGKDKPFKCDFPYCGKAFMQGNDLKKHMRIHFGEKPYECDICGRYFSDISTLKKHDYIHKDVKPHKCDVCGKSYVQKGTLRLHRQRHDLKMKKSLVNCLNQEQKTFKGKDSDF